MGTESGEEGWGGSEERLEGVQAGPHVRTSSPLTSPAAEKGPSQRLCPPKHPSQTKVPFFFQPKIYKFNLQAFSLAHKARRGFSLPSRFHAWRHPQDPRSRGAGTRTSPQMLAAAQSHHAVRRRPRHHTTACPGRGVQCCGGGDPHASLLRAVLAICSRPPRLGMCQAGTPSPRSPAAPLGMAAAAHGHGGFQSPPSPPASPCSGAVPMASPPG